MTLRQGRLRSMKADKKHLIWRSFCLFLLTMALSVILLPPAVSAAKSKVIAEGDCGKKNKETGEKSHQTQTQESFRPGRKYHG